MNTLLRPTSAKRIGFFLVFDLLLSLASLYLAYALRFNFEIPEQFLSPFMLVFAVLAGLKLFFFFVFKIYFIVWRFFGFSETKNILKAHLAAYGVFTVVYLLFSDAFAPFPRSVIIIDFFLSLFFIGALRISKRLVLEQDYTHAFKPTLILGVSSKTASIIKSAMEGEIPYYPAGIVVMLEENRSAVNTYISNVKVYGTEQLERLIAEKGIEAAIIAVELEPDALGALFERLSGAGVQEVKQVKLLGSKYDKLEDLSIEDLLARHPKDLDKEAIASFIKEKRILITGAGGSIGSEIAVQCKQFGAKELVLVDNSEYNLYSIGEKLPEATLSLQSVMHKEGLEKLFKAHDFDIVIHAAAYKHVPICEENIDMAVSNNVLGSKHVIDLSIAHGVRKVVVISTDKAVRPTNVMGATKRIGELYAQNVDAKETEIVAVRFGNVLGSSGSVIPKFKEQIENGGPVTVTHPEMTRYFMMIPEACQLVLQAASIAKGAELFILDMGEPVKIVDLAQQMIRLYGKEDEIKIEYCGLRPGEKMYEELLIGEHEHKTQYASIFVTHPTVYDIDKLNGDIEALIASDDKLAELKRIVPEFNHQP